MTASEAKKTYILHFVTAKPFWWLDNAIPEVLLAGSIYELSLAMILPARII